jgi:hypothetical protein
MTRYYVLSDVVQHLLVSSADKGGGTPIYVPAVKLIVLSPCALTEAYSYGR